MLKLPWKEVRQLRGEEIAYVPQDPASALNPSIRIGKQIVELHRAARHRHLRVAAAGRPRRAGRGRAAQRRRVPQALRPPALGRPGAARRAGDGVPAQAQGAGPRRADHRPRRHHPEDGARHDGRAVPHPRRQRALRHPRPRGDRQHRRPGRGDVRRADRRARPEGHDLRQPVAPLHARAARLDPAPEPGPRAQGHPGPDAGARARGRTAAASTTAARSPSTSAGSRCRSCAPSRPTTRCAASGSRRSATWDIHRGTVPDADPDRPRDVILSVDGLNVFYGRKQVVHDVTFDLAKGEVVALVGESGSGKTTISRSVGGLHKEWTGTIIVRGPRAGQERPPAQRRGPPADPVHLPEPLPVAEPAADDRADHQAADGAVRHRQGQGGHRAGGRADGPGGPRVRDAALPGQPALRRRAAARRDRPRAGRRARRDGLRRDHLGARRVGAGLDRRAARGAPAGARHQHAVRDPQPRPGPLDRRPRGDPAGGQGRRGRLGGRGHGDARRRTTPASCSSNSPRID